MILNMGQRTDIPAFFSQWFFRRVREQYVLARNPFFPEKVTRYRIAPDIVDAIAFCTKNPAPMLEGLDLLRDFPQMWFVTITAYGRDIEPNVPKKEDAVAAFRALSARLGTEAVVWRYDPVFITEKYSARLHKEAFAELAGALKGFARVCVVSFIDLYRKTLRNFPAAREVPLDEQKELTASFAKAAQKAGMRLKLCAESPALAGYGADVSGCMTERAVAEAVGFSIKAPAGSSRARKECRCLLGADIGAYNTCAHGCIYCYANADPAAVQRNIKRHDPASPFLIGGFMPGDIVKDAGQKSWRACPMAGCEEKQGSLDFGEV